jgi:hypothetical protein
LMDGSHWRSRARTIEVPVGPCKVSTFCRNVRSSARADGWTMAVGPSSVTDPAYPGPR